MNGTPLSTAQQLPTADHVMNVLDDHGYRLTGPRRQVVQAVLAHRRPFTAEQLVEELPAIGRATVYRTLEILASVDLLTRLLQPGGHPAYASPQIIMRQQHTNSGSRFGYTGLEDPEIDALVEKSETATDYQENVRLVKQVQLVSLQKYTGYVLLTSRIVEQLLYQKVRNWENDPSETYLPRYEAWIKA